MLKVSFLADLGSTGCMAGTSEYAAFLKYTGIWGMASYPLFPDLPGFDRSDLPSLRVSIFHNHKEIDEHGVAINRVDYLLTKTNDRLCGTCQLNN